MRFVEPIILQGINKDVAPNGIDNSNRKVLNPLRDALNLRYLSSEGGEEFQAENIKGTEIVPLPNVYTSLLVNGAFAGSLDGWTIFDFPSGGLVWTYSSGDERAQIVRIGAGTAYSVLMGQSINVIAGTIINSNFIAAITSGTVTSLIAVGYFLDADDNVLETFNIGSFTTLVVGESSKNIFFSKLVPTGAKKLGVAITVTAPGSFTFKVDTFIASGDQIIGNPDGINECIGTYENIEKNLLIYFLWNSNGYHGVYKYDSVTNSINQLLIDDPANPVLKFSNNPRYAITGVGMIGDILSWTDNLNPQRYINITREYTAPLSDFKISLIKIGPRKRPTFSVKQTDNNITTNNLEANSFQFASRYVYLDNEISVLSPFSDLLLAETIPDLNNKTRAFTNVTHYVDAEILQYVKYVQLLYRKNNDPNWYIWKSISFVTPTVVQPFYNHEIGTLASSTETTKIFDSIPNKSKALTIFKGRAFLNINEEGFEHETGVIFEAQVSAPVSTIGPAFIKGPFLKKHGKVRVGFIDWDKFGRGSLVAASVVVNGISWDYSSLTNLQSQIFIDPSNTSNVRVQAAISKFPGGFSMRKSIVMSEDIIYDSYFQTLAVPFFFVKNFTAGTILTSNEVVLGSRVYLKTVPNDVTAWSKLHLLITKESPFIPDTDYYIRVVKFLSGDSISSLVFRVNEVIDGDIIVVDGGIATWATALSSNRDILLIEVFKPKSVQEPFYYEVTEPSINVMPVATDIGGTQYLIGSSNGNNVPTFTFRNIGFSKVSYLQDSQTRFGSPVALESPAPIKTEKYITASADSITVAGIRSYSFDLPKSAWPKGRVFVEGIQRVVNRGATIRFSDPYIEGSEINGLNSVPVENVYDKIGQDRSSIVKFVPVGNVLLAVHERQVTTLYIGEGIVRTGETGFLSKVDSVVGDDRKLIGDYGSYHPESISEVSGLVFGWDIFSGVIWRYTVEGIYPVSDYGMKDFFRDKANAYLDKKDELKFVSSIDRYHKEYLITLPHLYETWKTIGLQTTTGASKTIDFSLAPDDYVLGNTYRMKISPWNQVSPSVDTITIAVLADGITVIKDQIIHRVSTIFESEATPIYVEFVYTGQAFNRINITNIDQLLYIRVSSEFQKITGETWAFNYEKKVWGQRYSFVPEFMGKIGNSLYSFKEGRLYKHNVSDVYNNFYGVQYESSLTVVCNPQPNKVKVWSALQLAAISLCEDETGSFKVMECENDQEQSSYTRAKEFKKREGVYYAPILRDINTSSLLLGAGKIALRDGKDMRSKSLEITIHNNRTDGTLLQKLNVIGEFSEFSI